MNVKVMKFGGTSLSDRQARQAAYRHVRRELETGRVLVVVSAMGRSPDPYATDTLLQDRFPLCFLRRSGPGCCRSASSSLRCG